MIEQKEDFHLQMLLQQLVSCVKLWHHAEIHRLRLTTGPQADLLSGVQEVSCGSSGKNSRKAQQPTEPKQTYSDILSHLYLFDLIDAVGLIGFCNREKIVRSLSLVLVLESSKLRHLVAGQDKRKSLYDLLYCNELAIRDRVAERMTLMKMFKFRAAKVDGPDKGCDTLTKVYDRSDLD
jgi:hypothetical protein